MRETGAARAKARAGASKSGAVMTRAAALLLTLSFLAALCGCSGLLPKEEEILAPPLIKPKQVDYDYITVGRGSIRQSVKGQATVTSMKSYDLSFEERGGYLEAINARNGDTVKAGDVLAELDMGEIKSEIERQRLTLRKAQLTYDQRYNSYSSVKAKNEALIAANPNMTALEKQSLNDEIFNAKTNMEFAQIDLQVAQMALDSLEDERGKMSIVSPIDGVVVYMAKGSIGDRINARTTMFRVVDPTRVYLVYSGDKVSYFELGREVIITDSKTKQTYLGHVTMTPATAPKDILDENKTFCAIGCDELPTTAIGYSYNIEMIQAQKDDVIVLPKNYVDTYNGETFVKVLVDGVKQDRQIETGLSDALQVEVVSGLEEGEQVIQD